MKAPFSRNKNTPDPPPAAPHNAGPAEAPVSAGTQIDPAASSPGERVPVTALDPPPPPAAAQQDAGAAGGNRGRLRRRMRYLRRAHELGLRDLGGLVFDLHRFGRRNDQLVAGKLHALDVIDAELRAIERALSQPRQVTEIREPGITACIRCGALIGTDARFCSACGTPISGPVAVGGQQLAPPLVDAPAQPQTPVQPPASPPPPPSDPLWSVPQDAAAPDTEDPAPTVPPDPRLDSPPSQ